MSGYNCTIEYIAGTTNTCADLLSRYLDNVQKTSKIQNSEEVEDQTVLDAMMIYMRSMSLIQINLAPKHLQVL